MSHDSSAIKRRPVFVVDVARTPFIKMRGMPNINSASDLAVAAARPLLLRQPFAPTAIDQVIAGCVCPDATEANIARLIALRVGCGDAVPAFTVQRNCASGLQAVDTACQEIASGRASLVLTGGTEAMSRSPLLFDEKMVKWLSSLNKAKQPIQKLQKLLAFRPHLLKPVIALMKGLTDTTVNLSMGQTAEEIAHTFGIDRTEMDSYAAQSHLKAKKAQDAGWLAEVSPLYQYDGKVHEQDDGIRTDSTVEKLKKLKPVFDKFGNITAGNSSQVTDGAAFMILASEAAVNQYQLPVLGRIEDVHWAGLSPSVMGLGPVHAMVPLLQAHNLRFEDIDAVEINEAFAAQVLGCQRALASESYCQTAFGNPNPVGQITDETLNMDGGSIALGHPVGASGARLVMHLLHILKRTSGRKGMASLCIGGGQGGAILLERV